LRLVDWALLREAPALFYIIYNLFKISRSTERRRDCTRCKNAPRAVRGLGKLNSMLQGWSNYFCHGTRRAAYRAIDSFAAFFASALSRKFRSASPQQGCAAASEPALRRVWTKVVFDQHTLEEESLAELHRAASNLADPALFNEDEICVIDGSSGIVSRRLICMARCKCGVSRRQAAM
jgi:Group II intron, maturase-specific domain